MNSEQFRERLLNADVCSADDLKGCSPAEFACLEGWLGFKLPVSYEEDMKIIGHGAGDFMSDVKMFFPDVLTLTEDSRALISDQIRLPDDAFVFASRYGDQLLFHRLQEKMQGTDPPIYKWDSEEPNSFARTDGSIWQFLEDELDFFEDWQDERKRESHGKRDKKE